jgi:hypothetical protein
VLVRLGELLAYPPRDRMPAMPFAVHRHGKNPHRAALPARARQPLPDPQRGTTRLPVVALQMPPIPHERDFYEELLVWPWRRCCPSS